MFLKLNIMQNLFKRLMPLIGLSILIATGCDKEVNLHKGEETISSPTSVPLNVDLVHVALHIEDKNMMSPVGDATPLFNNRGHTTIMAPRGHQVTLGEFNTVSGKADITCTDYGTNVAMQFQGLIPNGVYSIWVLTFKLPGFHGTFDNLIGNGALGSIDGSENAFIASSAGTASLSVTTHAESLSLFGSVDNCLFSEYEVYLAVAYHLDNLTHGGTPGDPATWVVQFAFPFMGGF